MKNYFYIFLFLHCSIVFADEVEVDGYTKKDGTVVQPYVRTSPNNTINDNWSTKKNVNPYTGEEGHISPESEVNDNSSSNLNNGEPAASSIEDDDDSSANTEGQSANSTPPLGAWSTLVIFNKVENNMNMIHYVNDDLTSFTIYKWKDKNNVTHYSDQLPFN